MFRRKRRGSRSLSKVQRERERERERESKMPTASVHGLSVYCISYSDECLLHFLFTHTNEMRLSF